MLKRVFKGNYYEAVSPNGGDIVDSETGRTLAQLVPGVPAVFQVIGSYIDPEPTVTVTPYKKADLTLAKHGSLAAVIPPLRGTSAYLTGTEAGTYTVNLGIYKQAPYLLYNRPQVRSVTLMADSEPTGLTATFAGCTNLTQFNTALTLGELTSATATFRNTSLTSIPDQVTLESLTDGANFFNGTPLTSLPSALNLRSLSSGASMFSGCKLREVDVKLIADTIKTWTSGTHALTLGIAAELAGLGAIDDLITRISEKGWTVAEEYNA